MPRTALRQPDQRQTPALYYAVLVECIHRVLAAGRHEPTRWQSQRRDHVSIQLYYEDQSLSRQSPESHQRRRSIIWCARRKPARSCCSSAEDIAELLPGSARMTINSPGSNSLMRVLATCRNFRETRWRCTALPTDFATTRPIRGPGESSELGSRSRRAWTTMSGCADRTPCLTVTSNSAARVIRC